MPNFETTIPTIVGNLKKADSYLESEKLIIQNVKQQLREGLPIHDVNENLKKLHSYISKQEQEKATSHDVIPFRYASACLKTMITTPYWHSWIEVA